MRRVLVIAANAGAIGCEARAQTEPRYAPAPRTEGRWVTLADGYSAEGGRQFIRVKGRDFRNQGSGNNVKLQ